MARPNCLLERMFNIVATPEQKQTLQNSFYARSNWGGAATFMTRIMAPHWFERMDQCNKKYLSLRSRVSTPDQTDDFIIPRFSFN
jgi:hypothetical protein